MKKKYKYYLVYHRGDEYYYSRGESFNSDYIEGLALVKIDREKNLDFKGNWAIIDVASGLFVLSNASKKKVLERYNEFVVYRDIKGAIERSRKTKVYSQRVYETEIEKQNWRASGYEVE